MVSKAKHKDDSVASLHVKEVSSAPCLLRFMMAMRRRWCSGSKQDIQQAGRQATRVRHGIFVNDLV